MSARATYLRLGGALLALAAGAAGIVVAVALLRSEPAPPGSNPSAATAAGSGITATPAATGLRGGRIPTPNQPGFPAPPPGALVMAREAGSEALGLAIVRGTTGSLVRVSVVSPSGSGQGGLDVAVSFGKRSPVKLERCGAGCYQAELATGSSRQAVVKLRGRNYAFTLPPRSRPADGAQIVARSTRVWRSLRTLVWHERLASSPSDVLHTVYVEVAPNELSYSIAGRSAAVIIGGVRWDRSSLRGPWVRSIQDPPVQVPVPFWYGVSDARVLASTRFHGSRVWEVSFFDPTTPAWFEAEIDKRSGRTLELGMVAASHFMHHVYGPFNSPLHLDPPPVGG